MGRESTSVSGGSMIGTWVIPNKRKKVRVRVIVKLHRREKGPLDRTRHLFFVNEGDLPNVY